MSEKLCTVCKVARNRLYAFPKDKVLRALWCSESGIDPYKLDKSIKICSVHFDSHQWITRVIRNGEKSVKALRKNAVPTLHLKEPLADPDGIVPPLARVKRSRCSVCFLPVIIARGAVTIFDEDDNYTQFGVTLVQILKLTSRKVSSRYCCQICADNVVNCFDTLVNLNVSTILTNRKFARLLEKRLADQAASKGRTEVGNAMESSQESRCSVDDEVEETEPNGASDDGKISTNESASVSSQPVFEEQCYKCDAVLDSKPAFTDHLVTHIFEDRTVTKKCIAMTQTSDFDTDLIEEEEQLREYSYYCPEPIVEEPVPKDKEENVDPMDEILRALENEGTEPSSNHLEAAEKGEDEEMETFWIEETLDEESSTVEEHYDVNMDERPKVEDTKEEGRGNQVDVPVKRKRNKRNWTPRIKAGGVCHLCGKLLKTQESLQVHIRTHKDTAEGRRPCQLCGTFLKNSKTLAQHMERVHNDPRKRYRPCDLCGKMRGNLYQHRKNCQSAMVRSKKIAKRKLPRTPCGVCGKSVHSIYLAKHLRLHEIEDDVAKNGPSALDKYVETCQHCGKKVKNLPLHLKIVHNIKEKLNEVTYKCEHCHATFRQRPLYMNHLKLIHNVDPRILSANKSWSWKTKWECTVCQEAFPSYKLIRKHVKAEHEGVGIDLNCESCGKHYNTLEALREHINIKHLNYFAYTCAACDRHFVSEESFTEHATRNCRVLVPRHKRDDSMSLYRCAVCHRLFVSEESFTEHASRNCLAPGEKKDGTSYESVTEIITTERYLTDEGQIKVEEVAEDEKVELYEYVPPDDAVVFYVDVD